MWLLAAALLFVLVILVVPPWISIGRYRSRIAQALSTSVGRPVKISSVELRLFPWPGFEINDLSIAEDPAYGAEPVLHANSVRANIRLLSLWRGRLEIGSIAVDEASLNIVHAGPGRWNLDPLFRTAAKHAGQRAVEGAPRPWPSLQATDSRINIKEGAEKLPFSLTDADLSFWQDDSGDWRIRMRGQPARTDVAVETGDTGVVRIEATIKPAVQLSQMPLTLDVDWREAQLGQLSRLLIGSDPGWRGDLTGTLHVDGTPDAAHVSARLSATGVHRAEFAPVAPLDFDANCTLLYHYASRSMENLSCDSPLGDGRIRLTGGRRAGAAANFTLELDRIPVAAGLDLMRTMRNGLAPELQASGTVSGKLEYAAPDAAQSVAAASAKRGAKGKTAPRGPLSGSLTVSDFTLNGGGLAQPLRAPKVVLQPFAIGNGGAEMRQGLEGNVPLEAGAPEPLNVMARLTEEGYEATFRGQASIARAGALAQVAGWRQAGVLSGFAGDPLTLNLTAAGPWLDSQMVPVAALEGKGGISAAAAPAVSSDTLAGTILLRNANWKADYFANHVVISQATLHLESASMRWDPVAFSYGPVKGTATLTVPISCTGVACEPQFTLRFGQLNAAALEAALLGAQEKGTLLSNLIGRLHPAAAPVWPNVSGTLNADALVLGPVTLQKASATLSFSADHADISDLHGNLLGGNAQGSGSVRWNGDNGPQPAYSFAVDCEKLNAAAVGQLLGQRWSGGTIGVEGKIDLAGFTGSQLASSAKGTLHFDWKHGNAAPLAPRFDEWSGDAAIADGALTLEKDQVAAGRTNASVTGSVTFATPLKVKLAAVKAK